MGIDGEYGLGFVLAGKEGDRFVWFAAFEVCEVDWE